jgi:hypothetical protein
VLAAPPQSSPTPVSPASSQSSSPVPAPGTPVRTDQSRQHAKLAFALRPVMHKIQRPLLVRYAQQRSRNACSQQTVSAPSPNQQPHFPVHSIHQLVSRYKSSCRVKRYTRGTRHEARAEPPSFQSEGLAGRWRSTSINPPSRRTRRTIRNLNIANAWCRK